MHAPMKHIVPGAQKAVLFVHGIVSTPRFFDEYIPALPADCSAYSILLPGHGGTVKDFGRHSAKEWENHVRAAIDELRESHDQVYIVAHSLGTLLAIRAAVADSTRIAGLLLLCVPLRIWAKPSALLHNTLKGVGLAENNAELRTYYGVDQDWRVWRYIRWIPRYLELFAQSRAARREVSGLTVPTLVCMAQKDELVSLRSVKEMADNPAIEVRLMPGSRHHEFAPQDKAALLDALRGMLQSGAEQI